jgi:predicted kinase
MNNKLISISGNPATGKTTLTKNISDKFDIPSVSMDNFKEIIYDRVEDINSTLWNQICMASYDLMFSDIEKFLPYTKKILFDAPINPEISKEVISKIIKKHNADFLEIKLTADSEVLWERFKKRLPSVHHCHSTQAKRNMDYMEDKIKNGNFDKKLDIGNNFLLIDTTDFEKINYQEIYNKIRNFLEK